MTRGTVAQACEEQGMKAVCMGESGCGYNTPTCSASPLSTSCNYWLAKGAIHGLSNKICNTTNPRYCARLEGVFTDWNVGDGYYGVVNGGAVSGDGRNTSTIARPLYGLCLQ